MTKQKAMSEARRNFALANKYRRKGGSATQKKRSQNRSRLYSSRGKALVAKFASQMWLVKIAGSFEVIVAYPGEGFFLPGDENWNDFSRIEAWVEEIRPTKNEQPKAEGFEPPPGSLWLVIVECIYNVIKVSDTVATGILIPGQEPCWLEYHHAEFLRQIR